MASETTRKTTLTRIERGVKRKLGRLAKANGRTMVAQLGILIEDACSKSKPSKS